MGNEIETSFEPITERQYKIGYVAAIDILGFADYTKDEGHYLEIRNLMNLLGLNKESMEANYDLIKFNICSDTLFISIEIKDEFDYDYSRFESIVNEICFIHEMVLERLGLLSRAGITIGEYARSENEFNLIFGPAVTRSACLAEHMDRIMEQEYPDCRLFVTRPAAIVIDNSISANQLPDIRQKLVDGCVPDHIDSTEGYEPVGGGFYLVNPFYVGFNRFSLSKRLLGIEEGLLLSYVTMCRRILTKIQETHPEKVTQEIRMLLDFAANCLR